MFRAAFDQTLVSGGVIRVKPSLLNHVPEVLSVSTGNTPADAGLALAPSLLGRPGGGALLLPASIAPVPTCGIIVSSRRAPGATIRPLRAFVSRRGTQRPQAMSTR